MCNLAGAAMFFYSSGYVKLTGAVTLTRSKFVRSFQCGFSSENVTFWTNREFVFGKELTYSALAFGTKTVDLKSDFNEWQIHIFWICHVCMSEDFFYSTATRLKFGSYIKPLTGRVNSTTQKFTSNIWCDFISIAFYSYGRYKAKCPVRKSRGAKRPQQMQVSTLCGTDNSPLADHYRKGWS